jgi:5-methylcytosine-specific restriction protein A
VKLATLKPRVSMQTTGPAPLTSASWTDDRRGTRQERGYGSDWDKLRLRILDRDQHLCQCQHCKASGILRPATHVDHTICKAVWRILNGSLRGADDPSNLKSMHKRCHERKTEEDRQALAALHTGRQ